MKILLVEDQASFYEPFIAELSTVAEVIHFKGSNAARRWLYDNVPDVVLCDHQILRFEGENRRATGDEVYHELRFGVSETIPFLHFSSEPCPEEYSGSDKDKFFHFKKKGTISPLEWMKKLNLIK